MQKSLGLVLIAAAIGCHKHDSSNAQKIFTRWELGWRRSQPCILGKIGRNKDAATQAELAQLYHERGDCPSWFSDGNHEIANVSALDSDKKRGEELSDAENAVNTFTELEPEDLTDDQAAAMTELIAAVDSARLHWPKSVGELVAARDKVRGLLGMPPSSWDITVPTTVTDLPATVAPPRNDARTDSFAFEAPKNGTVVFTGVAGDRHDVVLDDGTWLAYLPGKPPVKTKLAGVQRLAWACSAEHALWVLAVNDAEGRVVRFDAQDGSVKAGAGPIGDGPTCNDKAVTYEARRVLCTAGKDCETGEATYGSILVDDRLLTPTSDHASRLFAVRVSHGLDHVFRLPPKLEFSVLSVRDGKPYAYMVDGKELAIPWPLEK